ncbi:diacylglycerol kinase eta isoform X3 [Aphidius gifuensis]|uniref:diacylglycerol kinase eta isoform X3 n=1 Tax=Aphidius gifuensis TaxID=684658 RepID=UPI001CDD5ABC|nr:diacylglycerol kinase eta isoform X3 [Aphidius gifuensis]
MEMKKNKKQQKHDLRSVVSGHIDNTNMAIIDKNKGDNAESSGSETETEPARSFHRKLNTNRAIKNAICWKEGFLMKQTWSFQRWRRRYFKLKDRTLYYAKDSKDQIFDEIELTDLTLAECSTKIANHSFQVITPFRSLVLCGESRQDMEDWLSVLRTAGDGRAQGEPGTAEFLGGNHHWYATSHARPTYCNVCRDALYGVTSHGLSCEVCKYKVHKRCSPKAINNCKWTTLASIGKDIIEDQDGNIQMPHQWLEGNLPVSSKCIVCDKTCGSVLRFQDWRCLWCRVTIHTACRPSLNPVCPLGPAKLSVVPPTALHSIAGSDEAWEAVRPTSCSPLLVFVNSKSGDNQGVKFLRRFKQLLNPAQVFDLIKGGPGPGLRLFRHFDPFRILVCSGDGSVGWVLSEIDRLGMHKQCQVGVLPLGTGNDLARILGWGSSCDDDTHLPQLLEKYEKAGTKMLDRWSIMTFQRSITLPCHKISSNQNETILNISMVQQYENNVISHLTNLIQSDQDTIIISTAKVLHDTVKDFASRILEASLNIGDQVLSEKCQIIEQKLDCLLETLNNNNNIDKNILKIDKDIEKISNNLSRSSTFPSTGEIEKSVLEKPEKDMTNFKKLQKNKSIIIEKDVILTRANSLKRAIRQLVEHTETFIDEQKNITTTTTTNKLTTTTTTTSPTMTEDIDKINLYENKKYNDNYSNYRMNKSNSNAFLLPIIGTSMNFNNDASPCPSPTPNLMSLSPMPDLRRDSQADDMLTLPAPDGFADSRRNSSNNMPHEVFSFSNSIDDSSCQQLTITENNKYSEKSENESTNNIQVTITSSTLDTTTSQTDDTTVQDAMISPDSDSSNYGNISAGFIHRTDNATKTEVSRSSCSNSIVSSDSLNSDTLDSKSYTIKHSESEIDSDILDSTKQSECSEIGHIDSPENSELQNSESIVEDLSSLGPDLISTMLSEKYDSVRECVENDRTDKPKKYCSLAKFVEGNDIARRSFKRPSRYLTSLTPNTIDTDYQMANCKSSLLSPVCCFNVTSDTDKLNDKLTASKFPPAISVIVDPPSPSMSMKSSINNNNNDDDDNNLLNRRDSVCSMEKLSVELPDIGFSPQATRRISSGSLLKASEVVSLAATAARFGGSSMSLKHDRTKSVDKTEEIKKLPIINPLVQLPMWPNVSGAGGLISQALLANADALCAAVSPLMDPDETLTEGYFERCVMNNYFGIGIDAKISLDFHQKREEHPEKCRSRAKNYMWYGVLGSKQWLQKTYKNLEQRVQLECDGQRIPLPSLQGIVVLNIPSFMGGTNFWGGTKEGDLFLAPSFDDRILEVVAVFGSVQMAASRLINLQHHRIAQCQSVQINILGDEGVPIQVDGEAWVQPPGIIRIIHKNRMQMLYRNRALESSLKTWEEKQKNHNSNNNASTTVSQSTSTMSNTLQSRSSFNIESKSIQLYDEELTILISFIEVVTTLVKWVKLLIISHPSIEPDLYQIADRTALSLEKVHPDGKILEGPSLRPVVTEVVTNARQLYEESCELLRDKAHNLRLREDLENKLSQSLAQMEQELRKCIFDESGTGMVYLQNIPSEDQNDKKTRHRGLFWLKFRRSGGGTGNHLAHEQATTWNVQDVCSWLENLQLGEYTDQFISHDIRGKELLTLARRDLKELGIVKVGHVKRILQAIHDLNN